MRIVTQPWGDHCLKNPARTRVRPFQQVLVNLIDVARQQRVGEDVALDLRHVRANGSDVRERDALVLPCGMVRAFEENADEGADDHIRENDQDEEDHADSAPTVNACHSLLFVRHPLKSLRLEGRDEGEVRLGAWVAEEVLETVLKVSIGGQHVGQEFAPTAVGFGLGVERCDRPCTHIRFGDGRIGRTQVVEGEGGPVVRGDEGHGQDGQGEEPPTADFGDGGAVVGLPLPGPHQAKAVDKVVDEQCERAHEESSRINGAIPECQKDNLGHVGVALGQFKGGALELQIHGVLRGCPRGQQVPLEVSDRVQKLNGVGGDNFGEEEGVNLGNQAASVGDGRGEGGNDGDDDSRVDPMQAAKEKYRPHDLCETGWVTRQSKAIPPDAVC